MTEEMYLKYQNISCDDKNSIKQLAKICKDKEVLLLGPGNSMKRQKTRVKKFIEQNEPFIISVNYVPMDIKVDAVFLTNSKRYAELINDMQRGLNSDATIIATSNVIKTNGTFQYVLNYENLIDKQTEIIDNSLVMLLKAMIKLKVKTVYLAGFDGYSKRTDNYFDISREYSFAKKKASYLNSYVIDFLDTVKKKIAVNFITRSHYNEKK